MQEQKDFSPAEEGNEPNTFNRVHIVNPALESRFTYHPPKTGQPQK
jgi:hypothetical protein